MPASDWSLHSQLKKDTIDIGDLPLCRVLVIKDAHYPWLLLVPRRHEAVEIIDLEEAEQGQLMTEIGRVAQTCCPTTGPASAILICAGTAATHRSGSLSRDD